MTFTKNSNGKYISPGISKIPRGRIRRRLLLLLILIALPVFFAGCSFTDIANNELVQSKTDKDVQQINQLANNPAPDDPVSSTAGPEQGYYDKKSGKMVSKTAYYTNNVTDAIKLYGGYFTLFSAVIGFLIRRLVKNSVAVRRLGLALEVGVPIAYFVIIYGMSYIADRMQ